MGRFLNALAKNYKPKSPILLYLKIINFIFLELFQLF